MKISLMNQSSNKTAPQGDITSEDDVDEWGRLAGQAQSGDKKSYNKLLKEIAPFIMAVVTPKLAQAHWAQDLTQEILLSVHKSLHTYSADRPFKPWLSSIIHYRHMDFLRQYYQRAGNQESSIDHKFFSDQHVTKPDLIGEYADIGRFLQMIPENQRRVFELIKVQGYTAKEVANMLDMTESAVKVSAHRTLQKLKDFAHDKVDDKHVKE